MTQVVYNPSDIDFAKPGKHHYQLAFQMDSNWGSSLIPITVINGLKAPQRKTLQRLAALTATNTKARFQSNGFAATSILRRCAAGSF